jgi:pimeloyl-ACP methyl ester carboxylesterase
VTGPQDTGSTPVMTHRLADAIPEAKPLVLPDTRHLLPLERPAELNDALLHLIERSRR